MTPRPPYVAGLVCVACGSRYEQVDVLYTCPRCGDTGILDVQYDYERMKRLPERLRSSSERSIWRYMDLLPITGDRGLPSLQVGWTPVYNRADLADRYGVGGILIKDEGRNPTGSFKDRASAVGTVKARELGYHTLACASTGNAASSLAGFCASQGLESVIFIPENAPEAKVAQLRAFGAKVLLVQGPYEAAYDLCQEAVVEFGWYNRNCAVNPYLIEGKKTGGLEIAEQCASCPPDVVAVSVGDGCTIAGIWKGMKEMRELGVWDRLPRLLGVQPEGAAPIATAHYRGVDEIEKVEAHSVADSITVSEPRNWRKALKAVKESQGTWTTVTDDEIVAACKELASASGVFAEPAGAAGFAGVLRAVERGLLGKNDSVLIMVTGNGLKDIRGAAAGAPQPIRIGASLNDVRKAIGMG